MVLIYIVPMYEHAQGNSLKDVEKQREWRMGKREQWRGLM
jgi:hypothetical protein